MVPLAELMLDAGNGLASGERDPEGTLQIRMNNVGTDGSLDLIDVIRIPVSSEHRTRYSLDQGDVLFNNTNSTELVGKSTLFPGHDEPVLFSNHFTRLRTNRDRLYPSYLARWLTKQQQSLIFARLCNRWVNQSAVRKEALLGLGIPLPPLSEQKRIAAILDQADAIRRKRRQSLAMAADLIPAVFRELFGNPITNPRGWPTKTLGSLLENIDSGWSPPCEDRPAIDREWGVLKLGAVTYCEYKDTENKALPTGLAPRPELEVKPGDLLFTRKNTYELVAACALVRRTQPRMQLPDLIFRLRLKKHPSVVPEYLWQLLIDRGQRAKIQKLAGGSAGSMPNISKQRLSTAELIVPPLELQREFASIVRPSLEMTERMATIGTTESDLLFASLVQRAFRGDL